MCFSPRSTKYNKNTCCFISSHRVSSTLNIYPSQFYENQSQPSPPRSLPLPPSAQLWQWSSTSGSTVSFHHHWPWECTYEGRAEMGRPVSRGPRSALCSPPVPCESMRTVISHLSVSHENPDSGSFNQTLPIFKVILASKNKRSATQKQ